MTLRSLLVDFNSYFASVEQQVEPRLRGKPLGVVPMLADTTVCIAASVEAKTFGVKTGTKVAEARRLCPEIEFVVARHEIYIDYHHRAVAVVDTVSCRCARCSRSTRWTASSPGAGARPRARSTRRGR